ncbi:hypothetical protein N7528_001717 [Penicillium herquei]|nr:hypothetical protein N7528_001717 [Penicillium herquei]
MPSPMRLRVTLRAPAALAESGDLDAIRSVEHVHQTRARSSLTGSAPLIVPEEPEPRSRRRRRTTAGNVSRSVPFNPDLPPAAFPTLPFDTPRNPPTTQASQADQTSQTAQESQNGQDSQTAQDPENGQTQGSQTGRTSQAAQTSQASQPPQASQTPQAALPTPLRGILRNSGSNRGTMVRRNRKSVRFADEQPQEGQPQEEQSQDEQPLEDQPQDDEHRIEDDELTRDLTEHLNSAPEYEIEDYAQGNNALNPIYVSNMARMAGVSQDDSDDADISAFEDSDLDEPKDASEVLGEKIPNPAWRDIAPALQVEIAENLFESGRDWHEACEALQLNEEETTLLRRHILTRNAQIERENVALETMRANQLRALLNIDNSDIRSNNVPHQLVLRRATRRTLSELRSYHNGPFPDLLLCQAADVLAGRQYLHLRNLPRSLAGCWDNRLVNLQASGNSQHIRPERFEWEPHLEVESEVAGGGQELQDLQAGRDPFVPPVQWPVRAIEGRGTVNPANLVARPRSPPRQGRVDWTRYFEPASLSRPDEPASSSHPGEPAPSSRPDEPAIPGPSAGREIHRFQDLQPDAVGWFCTLLEIHRFQDLQPDAIDFAPSQTTPDFQGGGLHVHPPDEHSGPPIPPVRLGGLISLSIGHGNAARIQDGARLERVTGRRIPLRELAPQPSLNGTVYTLAANSPTRATFNPRQLTYLDDLCTSVPSELWQECTAATFNRAILPELVQPPPAPIKRSLGGRWSLDVIQQDPAIAQRRYERQIAEAKVEAKEKRLQDEIRREIQEGEAASQLAAATQTGDSPAFTSYSDVNSDTFTRDMTGLPSMEDIFFTNPLSGDPLLSAINGRVSPYNEELDTTGQDFFTPEFIDSLLLMHERRDYAPSPLEEPAASEAVADENNGGDEKARDADGDIAMSEVTSDLSDVDESYFDAMEM